MTKKVDNNPPNVFEGFEALSKSLLGNPGGGKSPDDEIPYIDPEDIGKEEVEEGEEKKEEKEEVEEPIKKKPTSVKEEVNEDDEEDESGEEDDEGDSGKEETDTEEVETEVTTFLKDRLSEELGWELDEDDKFESIKDVVDYMKVLVDENSKPKYHSKEIQALDEYVKNGGSISKYFKEVYKEAAAGVDYDHIDLTRESNQRLVVREVLKEQGLSSERIQKRLDRYEREGLLQDEASDAVELLKEYKSRNEEKLLDEQKKIAAEQGKQQQNFFENVQNSVKGLENIRGVKISNKEKTELLDYIFKPDSDGLTKYQKDYMSDIKNLIESAYFTKKGDFLIDEAKKKGSSDAYKEFHQKLKANKGKRSKNTGGLESGSDSDLLLSSLSKNLLSKV